MNWKEYKVSNRILSNSVESILLRTDRLTAKNSSSIMRNLPRAGASLYFDFQGYFAKNGPWLNRGINGFHENYYYLDQKHGPWIDQMIVNFYPAGLARFTEVPISELREKLIDADFIFGPELGQLHEKLGNTRSPSLRIQIMEEFLLSRLREADPIELALDSITGKIRKTGKTLSLPEVSAYSHLSYRQIERHFQRIAGTSMRSVAQMMRFEIFRNMVNTSPGTQLTEIALETGFYDQPQFIRKIKKITGLTPREFVRSENPCEVSNPVLSK